MILNGGFIGKASGENSGVYTPNAHFLKTKAGTFPNNEIGWKLDKGPYNVSAHSPFAKTEKVGSDIYIDSTGTYLFIMSGQIVYKYRFGLSWDIRTLSLYDEQEFSLATENISPRAIYFKPDGTKMYMAGISGTDMVYEYNLSTAWDLTSITYYQQLDVNATTSNVINNLIFSDDGTKMYILNGTLDDIFQWNLSTAWDISTAVYHGLIELHVANPAPTSFFISPDGIKLFVIGSNTDSVNSYTLSTAWDITTGSLDSYSLDVSAYENAPALLYFKSDGTKMYIDSINGDITEWELTTAWDLSTAYVNNSDNTFLTVVYETAPRAVQFKPDGTKMYVVGSAGDSVDTFDLSTAWDLSTATFTSVFSMNSQDTNPMGFFFKSDGTKMYMCGLSNDQFHSYDLSTAWDPTSATLNTSVGPLESGAGLDPEGLFYKPDGTVMYYVSSVTDTVYQHNLSTAWDLPAAGNADATFSVATEESFPTALFFKSDGTIMYVLGRTGDDVSAYNLSTAWDITTATHHYSVHLLHLNSYLVENDPSGLYISDDGTKVFRVGYGADFVVKFELSTAWDLRTANVPNHPDAFIHTELTGTDVGRGLCFSYDGSYMYIYCAGATNDIFGYSLSTPWMVSTASYMGSVSVNEYEAVATGIDISLDGTKLYATGPSGDGLDIFVMTTPFDITTASWDSFWNSTDHGPRLSNPHDIQFKYDGTTMYFNSGGTLVEYGLGTAWDPTSAVLVTDQGFNATTQVANYNDIEFSYDGSKMYVIGSNVIAQYNLADPWNVFSASHYHTFTSSSVTDISFAPTGDQLLEMTGGNTVHYRSLTTPWDISTLQARQNPKTVTSGGVSLQVATSGNAFYMMVGNTMQKYTMTTQWEPSSAGNATSNVFGSSQPQGIYGSNSHLYVVDNYSTSDRLYKLPLYTSGDLTSFNNNQDPLSQNLRELNAGTSAISPTSSDPYGIHFKPDGTRMFIADRGSGYIRQYDLSTPWDINSTSAKASLTSLNSNSGFFIDRRGKKVMTAREMSAEGIRMQTLDTPWSSLVVSSDLDEIQFPHGLRNVQTIRWDDKGKYMYVLNGTTPAVIQYQMRI